MTPQERKDAIRRALDEVYNKGNLDMVDQLYAPNCSQHDPTYPSEGIAEVKDFVRELRAANPDLHIDTHEILAEGDLTCTRWTLGGTSRGEFRGLPATGKSYVMSGITVDRWEGDRVVEEWLNYDMLGTLQQLGLLPQEAARPQSG